MIVPQRCTEGGCGHPLRPVSAGTQRVETEVRRHFPSLAFQTVIPRNIRLAEAPSFGRPVLLHDRSSRGAIAYLALAGEVLRREDALEERRLGRVRVGTLGTMEEILLGSDVGVKTTQALLEDIREQLEKSELTDSDRVWEALNERAVELLREQLEVPVIAIEPAIKPAAELIKHPLRALLPLLSAAASGSASGFGSASGASGAVAAGSTAKLCTLSVPVLSTELTT